MNPQQPQNVEIAPSKTSTLRHNSRPRGIFAFEQPFVAFPFWLPRFKGTWQCVPSTHFLVEMVQKWHVVLNVAYIPIQYATHMPCGSPFTMDPGMDMAVCLWCCLAYNFQVKVLHGMKIVFGSDVIRGKATHLIVEEESASM